MIHTDGDNTFANAPRQPSPSASYKPAHGGYPGEIRTSDQRCSGTGLRIPECSCVPCLERLYRLNARAK